MNIYFIPVYNIYIYIYVHTYMYYICTYIYYIQKIKWTLSFRVVNAFAAMLP